MNNAEIISKIEINYYFSIRKMILDNFSNNEIYFLGENGVGKTILLQAILFALKGKLNSIAEEVKDENVLFQKYKGISENKISFSSIPKTEKKYIYAYGVNRNAVASSDRHSEDEYSTLFYAKAELLDPISWLQKLKFQELEDKENGIENANSFKLETAKSFLKELFDESVEIEVSASKVIFTEKGTNPLEFRQLSDGYKTVLIWVCDLIQRMSKKQINVTKLQDFRGTVLIDELDLFLHPKWAYKIMEKLRGWFPSIQFIISTHSPSLILGASEDAIFYKVYKENGETKITEPVSGISNLMANSVLTSPLFDLEFAGSREMKKDDFYKKNLDTSGHFNIYKINQGIEKRIKAERANLKIQITENEIEKWVEEALNEAEREMK